jgi:hypothetical protein
MITRTAIFEGRIKEGCEQHFFAGVQERLVPLWKQFPEASNIRVFRIAASDEDALPIAMIQQIDYPSLSAVDAALASPFRTQARAVTMELMEMFDGRFYHLVSEGNAAETAA